MVCRSYQTPKKAEILATFPVNNRGVALMEAIHNQKINAPYFFKLYDSENTTTPVMPTDEGNAVESLRVGRTFVRFVCDCALACRLRFEYVLLVSWK